MQVSGKHAGKRQTPKRRPGLCEGVAELASEPRPLRMTGAGQAATCLELLCSGVKQSGQAERLEARCGRQGVWQRREAVGPARQEAPQGQPTQTSTDTARQLWRLTCAP